MADVRTFIAFDTPLYVAEVFVELQAKLRNANADVRWEDKNKFHATMKFLGNVSETLLPSVIDSIRHIVEKHRAFEIVYRTVGGFPNMKRPRVLWVGCEEKSGTLLQAKTEIDDALLPLGFTIEDRAFHPHITLGRVKSEKNIHDLLSIVESLNFEPQKTVIREILVVRSILHPHGSDYSILKTISLHTEMNSN